MATLKSLSKTSYLNPYNTLKSQLMNKPLFNEEDWTTANKNGELDLYAYALQNSDRINVTDFYNKYNLFYGDPSTRIGALYSELNSDDSKKVKRQVQKRDANGELLFETNEKGEAIPLYDEVEMTDKEYIRYVISTSNADYAKQNLEKSLSKSRIDHQNFMTWVHDVVALPLNVVQGALGTVDNILGLMAGTLAQGTKSFQLMFDDYFERAGIDLVPPGKEKNLRTEVSNLTGRVKSDKAYFERLGEQYLKDISYAIDRGFSDETAQLLANYEYKYTHFVDENGNYTTLANILKGVTTTFGQMLPTMGLGGLGEAAFYSANVFVPTVVEDYKYKTENDLSISSQQIISKAATMTAAQIGISKLLGTLMGSTGLKDLFWNQTKKGAVNISTKNLTSNAVLRIGKDMFQEGLEEALQETSDFLVNKGFIKFVNENFQDLKWDWETVGLSFIIGMLTSGVGSGVRVLGVDRVNTGKIKTDKSGDVVLDKNGNVVFKKLNKLASYEYGLDMNSLSEMMSVLKECGEKIKANADGIITTAYSEKKRVKAYEEYQAAYYQAVATYQILADLYGTFGEEKFNNANEILKRITKDINDDKFDVDKLEENYQALSFSLSEFAHGYNASILEKVKDAEMTDITGSMKMGESAEAEDTELAKALEKMNTNADYYGGIDTVITTSDGNKPITLNNVLVIPERYLKNADDKDIISALTEQELTDGLRDSVKILIEGITEKRKYFKEAMPLLVDLYAQYSGLKDVTENEAIYNLVFNPKFFEAVLAVNEELTSTFVLRLNGLVKTVKSEKGLKNRVLANKIRKCKEAWIEAAYNFYSNNLEMNAAEFVSTLETKEAEIFNKRLAKTLQLYNMGKGIILKPSEVSEETYAFVDRRIDGMNISEDVKNTLKSEIRDNKSSVRLNAINKISEYYNGAFTTLYNGQYYMPKTSMANMAFNDWLKSIGLNLRNIFDSNLLTEYDLQQLGENPSHSDIVSYRQLQFETTHEEMGFFINDSGNFVITSENANDGFSNYQTVLATERSKIIEGKDFKIGDKKVDRKIATDLQTTNKWIKSFLSHEVLEDKMANWLTVDDIVNHPEYLDESIQEIILSEFGALNNVNVYRYLQQNLADDTNGDKSLVLMQDGRVYVGDMTSMKSMLLNQVTFPKTGKFSIGKFVNEKYLRGDLANVTVEFVTGKHPTGYVDYENGIFVNKIYVNTSYGDEYTKFAMLHELQHAYQTSLRMNLGMSEKSLELFSEKDQQAIIKEVQKIAPELFVNVGSAINKGKAIKDIVNSYIYHGTGEAQAMGLGGVGALSFYPIRVTHKNGRATITFKNGSSYTTKLHRNPSIVGQNMINGAAQVINRYYSKLTVERAGVSESIMKSDALNKLREKMRKLVNERTLANKKLLFYYRFNSKLAQSDFENTEMLGVQIGDKIYALSSKEAISDVVDAYPNKSFLENVSMKFFKFKPKDIKDVVDDYYTPFRTDLNNNLPINMEIKIDLGYMKDRRNVPVDLDAIPSNVDAQNLIRNFVYDCLNNEIVGVRTPISDPRFIRPVRYVEQNEDFNSSFLELGKDFNELQVTRVFQIMREYESLEDFESYLTKAIRHNIAFEYYHPDAYDHSNDIEFTPSIAVREYINTVREVTDILIDSSPDAYKYFVKALENMEYPKNPIIDNESKQRLLDVYFESGLHEKVLNKLYQCYKYIHPCSFDEFLNLELPIVRTQYVDAIESSPFVSAGIAENYNQIERVISFAKHGGDFKYLFLGKIKIKDVLMFAPYVGCHEILVPSDVFKFRLDYNDALNPFLDFENSEGTYIPYYDGFEDSEIVEEFNLYVYGINYYDVKGHKYESKMDFTQSLEAPNVEALIEAGYYTGPIYQNNKLVEQDGLIQDLVDLSNKNNKKLLLDIVKTMMKHGYRLGTTKEEIMQKIQQISKDPSAFINLFKQASTKESFRSDLQYLLESNAYNSILVNDKVIFKDGESADFRIVRNTESETDIETEAETVVETKENIDESVEIKKDPAENAEPEKSEVEYEVPSKRKSTKKPEGFLIDDRTGLEKTRKLNKQNYLTRMSPEKKAKDVIREIDADHIAEEIASTNKPIRLPKNRHDYLARVFVKRQIFLKPDGSEDYHDVFVYYRKKEYGDQYRRHSRVDELQGNLKYFAEGKEQINMNPFLREFIIHTTGVKLDKKIQEKIEDGSLEYMDLIEYVIDNEVKNIDPVTFDYINKYIFKNEYIKNAKELHYIGTVLAPKMLALKIVLKDTPHEELLDEELSIDKINAMFDLYSQQEEYRNDIQKYYIAYTYNVGFRRYSKSKMLEGKYDPLDADILTKESIYGMAFDFDGTVNSGSAQAANARHRAYTDSLEIGEGYKHSIFSKSKKSKSLDTVINENKEGKTQSLEDVTPDMEDAMYRESVESSTYFDKSKQEMLDRLLNVEDAGFGGKVFNIIVNKILNSDFEGANKAIIAQSKFNKYKTQVESMSYEEQLGLYNLLMNDLSENEIAQIYVLASMSGEGIDMLTENEMSTAAGAKDIVKATRYTYNTVANIQRKINTIRKYVSETKEVNRFLKENGDIFNKDFTLKETAYKNFVDGKSSYKTNDEIRELDERINELSAMAKSGLYSNDADRKNYIKQREEMRRQQNESLKKILDTLGKVKSSTKFVYVPVQMKYGDETVELKVLENTEVPNVIKQILAVGLSKTAITKVQELSSYYDTLSEDGRIDRVYDSTHLKMAMTELLNENAELLNNLSEDEAVEFLEFYASDPILISSDEGSRVTFAVQRLLAAYLLGEYRNSNRFEFDADLVKRVESKLESIASIGGWLLSEEKTVIQMLRPEEILMQSLAKSYDIKLDDEDKANLAEMLKILRSRDEGAPEKFQKAKDKFHKTVLRKYGKNKRSTWSKLLQLERAMMLSNPGTWIRNQVSNVIVIQGNKWSEKTGDAILKIAMKVFPKSDKFLRDDYVTIKKGDKDKKYYQYRLNKKVTKATTDMIHAKFIKTGLLKDTLDGISKYNVDSLDHSPASDNLTDMIARNVIQEITRGEVFDANGKLLKHKLAKGANEVIKFVYKRISDDKYVRNRTIQYFGKIIEEDIAHLRATDYPNLTLEQYFEGKTERDKSGNFYGISNDVAIAFSKAANLAMYDFMKSPNTITYIEKQMRQNWPEMGYFMYKQVFPFLASSWNWCVEAMRYSPLGLVKSVIDLCKLDNHIAKLEKANQEGKSIVDQEFARYLKIRNIGKGTIGSFLFLTGMILAGIGLARFDEEDEEYVLTFGNIKVNINDILGSQGIAMGIAMVSGVKDDSDWMDVLGEICNQLFRDSVFEEILKTGRYNTDVSGVFTNEVLDMPTLFWPNALKSIASVAHHRGVTYSDNKFIARLQRYAMTCLPIPAESVGASTSVDPYTGELSNFMFNGNFWSSLLSKVSPVDVYHASSGKSNIELEAMSLDVNKGNLTGKYTIGSDSVTLNGSEKRDLNEFYGKLNSKDLNALFNNKTKKKVQEPDGTYTELYYNKMSEKQKKAAIESIMTNNSSLSKIYILTSTGQYKYYASDSEYQVLRKLGVTKNVYKNTSQLNGFVKIN